MLTRRELIIGTAATCTFGLLGAGCVISSQSSALVRPPGGQDESRLIGACIHCNRCVSACPEDCIKMASVSDGAKRARTPYLEFKTGFCTFCGNCIAICPTSALLAFDPQTEKLGVAQLEANRCLYCKKCVDACAYHALSWNEDKKLPEVKNDLCNGCGACEHICPSSSYGHYSGEKQRAMVIAPTTIA